MSVVAPGGKYHVKDQDIILGDSNNSYVLRVKDLAAEEKPREKMLAGGPGNLAVSELVAILLGCGTRKEEVLSMARRILKEYGERTIMNETDPRRLADTLGIPIGKACQIVASFELGRRFFDTKAGKPIFIRTASHAYDYLKDMGHIQKEQLKGLYLNSRYQLIHEEVISVGSLTSNVVHPREVFQPAIERSAVAVIIAHNHPSGSLEPTYADIDVTKQLADAGSMLGIELLDHLIITNQTYQSIITEGKDR